ncbi:MAG: periplasmic heavy metal sensor [Burkholderiales bacterium]|nr:periplasmic heavy metal sensor [Burkholderiales bacterium]
MRSFLHLTFTRVVRAAPVVGLALLCNVVAAQTHAPIPAPGMPAYGMPYGNYFAALKAKLKLSTEQEAQYAIALKATNKANDTLRKVRDESAKTLRAELSKPEPDFAKVLAQGAENERAVAPDRNAAIAEWVKFTQTLSAEQKRMVASQLLDRVTRAEALREKFRKQHGG